MYRNPDWVLDSDLNISNKYSKNSLTLDPAVFDASSMNTFACYMEVNLVDKMIVSKHYMIYQDFECVNRWFDFKLKR